MHVRTDGKIGMYCKVCFAGMLQAQQEARERFDPPEKTRAARFKRAKDREDARREAWIQEGSDALRRNTLEALGRG